ncbi:hypothetical protein [Nitratireductor sp. ZSWI3]|uniref:hypothetical protein n=1 Tax=Nitratireductor sp. ZSWI3 TaxID=2966359 RepID=UPI00214FC89B|nr:hypothetical protein [Nitratireductor sp. ZSWI3]MCR4264682.1 hypothetical protein [Nitratireductor sp. ZSWI3]
MISFLRLQNLLPLTALVLAVPVSAHEAPSGWNYPMECCSNRDCQQIPANDVIERSEGYLVKPTGETLSYTDSRLRKSPDGVYHLCAVKRVSNLHTICLFVPPQSF